jgi:glycosyltransferase involved in cell wall biosynthesis
MKIGFDAKRAFSNSTGLGNYSRWVIRSFASQYPEHELYLFAPEPNTEFFGIEQLHQNVNIITPDSSLGKLFPYLWRTYSIANICNELELDIYHGLSNELPVGINQFDGKKVVTIHDLIFLRYPGYYNNIDKYIYKKKFQYACQNANHIIAASQQTAADISTYFNSETSKISVIYQDCDVRFRQSKADKNINEEVFKKYHIQSNYILTIGTIESRKNQLSLLKAFHHARIEHIQLVIVGKRTTYADELDAYIREWNLSDKVSIINDVPFDDLPILYQSAFAFAYVSEFEGFGIPLLEAMRSQTPILSANTSSLTEVAGNAAIYCHPHDIADMAIQLKTIVNDEPTRKQLIINAKKQLEKFDKFTLMEQMLNIYQL